MIAAAVPGIEFMVVELISPRQAAGADGNDASDTMSSFARNVSAMLERTEYRRCDKGEDLEDIYRLRYK
ncbi:MAG: hypothetical protein E5W25_29540, partial [Mesorhizobium sp.]